MKARNRDLTDKNKDKARKLRNDILALIHPSQNYICYFTEWFPDMDTKKGKTAIRNVWNGVTSREDVIKMMESVIAKLKTKK